MQHNFMPGNYVQHRKYGLGEVTERGASFGRYYVRVRFLSSGEIKEFKNDEIKQLKRA